MLALVHGMGLLICDFKLRVKSRGSSFLAYSERKSECSPYYSRWVGPRDRATAENLLAHSGGADGFFWTLKFNFELKLGEAGVLRECAG